MAAHLRKQIRDAAVTALTGLTTTGSRVFPSQVYPLQDSDLPGLKIDTNDEDISIGSMGTSRALERSLQLKVAACVKQVSAYNDQVDQIIKEVEIALASNQTLGGLCKYVQLVNIAIELAGEGEQPVAIGMMTFEVLYYAAQGTPDTSL